MGFGRFWREVPGIEPLTVVRALQWGPSKAMRDPHPLTLIESGVRPLPAPTGVPFASRQPLCIRNYLTRNQEMNLP